MPTISMFFGIVIRMFFDDHNPPHFHADYQDCQGVFDLDGEMTAGDIPSKQQQLIKAWAIIHREELEADWQLAANQESVFKIEPLR